MLRRIGIALCTLAWAGAVAAAELTQAIVVTGEKAADVELNAARLLADRLMEPSGLPAKVVSETEFNTPPEGALAIFLGLPEHHSAIAREFESRRIPPLTELAPGPEGFLLRSWRSDGGVRVLAAAIEPRAAVYAAGEILRRTHFHEDGVDFPDDLDIRTAPAFEVRGTQFGQSRVAREVAKVRPWTLEETRWKIAERALAGANTLEVDERLPADDPAYQYIKSLGLKTLVHYGPNIGQGPPEWLAQESIGRLNYLCPSVPEARAHLLEKAEALFSKSPSFDYVRFVGGDGGGCECDRCDPYGAVYIRLCEDMAAIVHKYHPDAEIFITNQKFDNDDDIAIFEYLQEKPRKWLRAFCYGPGSDAMTWQPGHRQHHRMDLFRYPGFGPFSRYCHEILHQLPPQQDLVFFNEVTHWRYAQHAYIQAYPRPDKDGNHPPHWNHFIYERMPDKFLTMVYDRLTFFAWPRFYHWVFGETVRYGIGDVTHSSGTHDHFNQWMWQRLLWNPQRTPEEVVDEYARTWFGPEAAPLMAEAIFLLEENIQEDFDKPLPEKEGIDRYYRLVKDAGDRMPSFLREKNWLWREFMQKGAIDKRTKVAVAQQMDIQARIERRMAEALESGDLDAAIADTRARLDTVGETDEMRALREEAEVLGKESNALYGVRSEGLANLDHDFIGLGWIRRQLDRAEAAPADEKREILALIADYENPGPGGFYDNCGTYEDAPHLVYGYPYDHGQPYVPGMLFETNRLSQRTMCYTQDEAQGVTFKYDGLDPDAAYKVRMTLVRPWYQERYRMRMNQKAQNVYADDILLAEALELPEQQADFFTFDIPVEATRDGELTIRLEKMPDVGVGDRVTVEQWRNTGGWGTLISEIWLIRK